NAGLLGFREPVCRGGPPRRGGARHRQVPEDCHENVVEIVRDAARQQSERCELAGLRTFLLHPQRIGDIAKGEHDTYDAAVAVTPSPTLRRVTVRRSVSSLNARSA